MRHAILPEAGELVDVAIPGTPKPLILESQLVAAEDLADASMIAFSAKAEFGSGVTDEMVLMLEKAREAFRRATENTEQSVAKTMRPARRGRV